MCTPACQLHERGDGQEEDASGHSARSDVEPLSSTEPCSPVLGRGMLFSGVVVLGNDKQRLVERKHGSKAKLYIVKLIVAYSAGRKSH